MTIETKIVLKSLLELEGEINSGKTASAAGINHSFASVWLLEPGRYIANMDVMGRDCSWWTGKDEVHTLAKFIEEIPIDETEAWDLELKIYLGQQIWFVEDHIDPWDTKNFVWPANHKDSMEVIHACYEQAKMNKERAGHESDFDE